MNFDGTPYARRRDWARLLRQSGFLWLIGHGLFHGGLQQRWVLPVLIALFGAAEIVEHWSER